MPDYTRFYGLLPDLSPTFSDFSGLSTGAESRRSSAEPAPRRRHPRPGAPRGPRAHARPRSQDRVAGVYVPTGTRERASDPLLRYKPTSNDLPPFVAHDPSKAGKAGSRDEPRLPARQARAGMCPGTVRAATAERPRAVRGRASGRKSNQIQRIERLARIRLDALGRSCKGRSIQPAKQWVIDSN